MLLRHDLLDPDDDRLQIHDDGDDHDDGDGDRDDGDHDDGDHRDDGGDHDGDDGGDDGDDSLCRGAHPRYSSGDRGHRGESDDHRDDRAWSRAAP